MVRLLHLRFDADLSSEEIEAQWQAAVDELALGEQLNPGGAGDQVQAFPFFPPLNRWVIEVSTRTGTGQNDGTDDRVRNTIWYEGDGSHSASIDLDNPGDDRERGQYDRYLFYGLGLPSSIRFTRARIGLQGTDGWGLDYFHVVTQGPYGEYNQQYTGGTGCHQFTRHFLDNATSTGWDYSNTTLCSGIMTLSNNSLP